VNRDVRAGEQRGKPRRSRVRDKHFPYRAAAQRGLDQVGPLGEELAGPLARDVPVQLRRGRYPRRTFGEESRAGGQS
jgi:hypothetical protein